MDQQEIIKHTDEYRHLRDAQFALFEMYARGYGLTAKELFVLYILWFSPDGCQQADISERLSTTKQTISSMIKKLWKQGYTEMTEDPTDRRRKLVRLTAKGRAYAEPIIAPAAQAEIDAMAALAPADIAELTRLTQLFSDQMALKFHALTKEEQ